MANNINWNLYKTFTVAYETKNLYRTAEILGVSRSAIGQNIKEIERQLGVNLFIPNHRGITSTGEADALYTGIKNAVVILENAESDLQILDKNTKGILKIMSPMPMVDNLLADTIADFYVSYPNVKFDLLKMRNFDLLFNGEVDFIIDLDCMFPNKDIKKIDLFQINPVFIASKKFINQTITKNELTKLPLVSLKEGTWAELLSKEFPQENIIIKTDSSPMIIKLVKSGIGVGCISKELFNEMNDPEIIALEISDFSLPLLKVVCGYTKSLSKPAKTFIRNLQIYLQ